MLSTRKPFEILILLSLGLIALTTGCDRYAGVGDERDCTIDAEYRISCPRPSSDLPI